MTAGMQKSFRLQRLLSAIVTFGGVILMGGKIVVDSEPGAVPLLLVVLGAGWYITTRIRASAGQKID